MVNNLEWMTRVLNLCECSNELTGDGYTEIADFVEDLKPLDYGISGRRVGALLSALGFRERVRGSKGIKVYLSAAAIAAARESLKKLNGGEC